MNIKVESTIRKFNMIEAGDKILVALSGGSDSMSLLYSLLSLKDKMNFSVEAAHVNHSLRGNDSDNDENFVRNICAKLGVKLYVLKADVKTFARENGISLEDAGRKIRYEYFNSVCPDGKIATAHNLNDRIETFLFNFSRGSGLKGLCSIPPVRDKIIRPLIECSKDEILNYCSVNGISYVTDKTNADTEYSRNRIRHNVIPQLKQINSSFEKTALRCIESLNEDEKYLFESGADLVSRSYVDRGYDIEILLSAAVPIIKRALLIILSEETGPDIDMECVLSVFNALMVYSENGKGMTVQLPLNRFARTRHGLLEFPSSGNESAESVSLNEGISCFGDFEIKIDKIAVDGSEKYSQNICKDVSIFYCDCDKICGQLMARTRMPGDSISISRRKITKSLRKLMNERGIAPEIRDTLPVISDDNGFVCAFGCGIDSEYEVNSNTENVFKIQIKRGK